MFRRTTAVLTAALVLGAVAAPAALANGRRDGEHNGGKKPVGTVASFDGTTLTVAMKDGSSKTATAGDDTKVKIDHRGRPAAKGNPTRGSLEDLVAGALVLRMKIDDGALEKVRIRRAAAEAAPAPAASAPAADCAEDADSEGDEADDAETEGDEADDAETEGDEDADAETEGDEAEDAETEGDESDNCADDADDTDDTEEEEEDVDEDEQGGEEEEEEGNPVDEIVEELPLP